mgnify:CR=1 FL=1
MSKETTELLNTKIYPAIYEKAEQIFPEFAFKRTAGGYVSTTDAKITGEKGKPGKVYYYENNPKHLIDYTRGSIHIDDYIKREYNLSTLQEVILKLAELSGVSLPKRDFDTEAYEKHRREAQLWEDAQHYFTITLMEAEDPKAKALQKYLKEERNYTPEDIQAMNLGCITSQKDLRKHLKGKGYTDTDLEQIKLNEAIGKTHTLTIPLREPGGKIRGISARTITDAQPKYLYSTGLSKADLLFNLRAIRGKKDLVIVEGILDALLCSARGIENIVALGGKDLTKAQLETAVKYGAQKITLCLDNEEKTILNTLKAIDLIQREQLELKIFVAQLPEGVKDPDELIRNEGAGAFKKVIAEAIPYYKYQLEQIFKRYDKLQDEETGSLTPKDEEDLIQEIITTAQRIKDPIDRDRFTKSFLDSVEPLGITKGSLDATVEKLRYKEEEEKQKKSLQALISEAQDLQREGKTAEAIELLQTRAREVKQSSNKITFESLLIPVTEEGLRDRQIAKPKSLSSGYEVDTGDELLLPAGAVTIFSAPTSHGKTAMLINLALNTAEKYPEKQFHIFSYEEDRDSVVIKALNTYLNEKLSWKNIKTLKSYYSQPEDERYKYFRRSGKEAHIREFEEGKEKFFRDLIDSRRLNIHYVDYDSDTLIEAIDFLNKKDSVGAVFIDYMQLLRKKSKKEYNSRQEELKQVCLDLKDLAVETGLPIILGAQFNRTVVNHSEILATNIGEAGDIERAAHTIIGFWNNNFEPTELKDKGYEGFTTPDTLYGIVLKRRDEKRGIKFLLKWEGNTGKISREEKKTYKDF